MGVYVNENLIELKWRSRGMLVFCFKPLARNYRQLKREMKSITALSVRVHRDTAWNKNVFMHRKFFSNAQLHIEQIPLSC